MVPEPTTGRLLCRCHPGATEVQNSGIPTFKSLRGPTGWMQVAACLQMIDRCGRRHRFPNMAKQTNCLFHLSCRLCCTHTLSSPTLSRMEFSVRYRRLGEKRVLYQLWYHIFASYSVHGEKHFAVCQIDGDVAEAKPYP